MDSDGTQDTRGTHANPVPRPAGPPDVPGAPAVPPRPTRAPGMPPPPDGSAFLTWLRTPRPEAQPGVWRFGHRPRPEEEPERIPARQLLSGAVIAFLVGWLIWSLLWNGYLGTWWLLPLDAMTSSWTDPQSYSRVVLSYVWYTAVALGIMIGVGRLGRWDEIWQRYVAPRLRRTERRESAPPVQEDPAAWPQLRAAGAADAAERLAAD
ncbi:ATP-binding protein, partial [Streptomyces sp. 15-116A]|nr:ATP-binding protein [Streptomyces sp. 15-116A]